MLIAHLSLLLAACHSDASLAPKDGAGFDSGENLDTDPAETGTGDDPCNGLDDNGDGRVDEGYPDVDEDGIADCVDPTCSDVEIAASGTVPTVATCTSTQTVSPVRDAWATTVKWTWSGISTGDWGVVSGPIVAVTDDTNGDGLYNTDDTPTVIVVTSTQSVEGGSVIALNGATGTPRWRYTDVALYQQPGVADVDGDGIPEVLVLDKQGYVLALRSPGVLLWKSSEPVDTLFGSSIQNVADLEGDGTVEVVVENAVIEGATGVVRFKVHVDRSTTQLGGPSVADLDGDGRQEVLYNGSAFDASGRYLWGTGDRNFHGNWAVPVQADADPDPELVMIGEEYGLYESDGTQLSSLPYQRGAYAGAPCAGDFDGDGEVEVAFGSWSNFLVMSLDGAIEWQTPIEDSSCCGGCSGFDLDGDGGLEILYNDHTKAYIFDAAAGVTLAEFPRYSGTIYEYPVVVDVDDDGASELLVTSEADDMYPSLTVLAQAGDGWPSLGTTWSIHDFAVCNIGEDSSVPTHPDPYWSEYRVYRGRVPVTTELADLYVTFVDACVMDCVDGPAELSLQVGNQGLVDVPEGSTLALYALAGGEAREIDRWTLPAVASGQTLAGIDRLVLPEEIGVDGFRAVVTPPNRTDECETGNNTAEWTDVPC